MFYDSAIQAVGYLSTVLFLWVGARMVMEGDITIGGFVAFNAIVAMAYTPILTALGLWDEFQMSDVLMNRLNDVLRVRAGARPRPRSSAARALPRRPHGVARRVVSLRRPGSPLILDEHFLRRAAGQDHRHRRAAADPARPRSSNCSPASLDPLREPSSSMGRHADTELPRLRQHVGLVLQGQLCSSTAPSSRTSPWGSRAGRAARRWAAQIATPTTSSCAFPWVTTTRIGGNRHCHLRRPAPAHRHRPRDLTTIADPHLRRSDERIGPADRNGDSRRTWSRSSRTGRPSSSRTGAARSATADNIIVLEEGAVVEAGSHEELLVRKGLYFYLHSQQMGI